MKRLKKGFTLIELVVVIAVVAILSAVSAVSYVSVTRKAKESKALTEAKQAWTQVTSEYYTYNEFISSGEESYGWRFDFIDDIAKFDTENYTVTYNGKEFKVVQANGPSEISYGAIESPTVDLSNPGIGVNPYGLKVSFYDGKFTRGFSWATNADVTASELYVVESNLGQNANFTNSLTCSTESIPINSSINLHKAYVLNLKSSTTYSYKVGSSSGYKYGVFRTASSSPKSLTAIHISDAQTVKTVPEDLGVWENTFAQSIETAGRSLDFVLYNGDQFQHSNATADYIGYSAAVETIYPYSNSIPYMASSGNHEFAGDSYMYANNNCINYPEQDLTRGGFYSFDYLNAHFVVLNTSNGNEDFEVDADSSITKDGKTFYVCSQYVEQATWLLNDLANAKNAKWIIVTMHVGPHSTGDHSDSPAERNIVKTFTPIFSAYHVDLVLQAHDHVYTKTMPYKWDAAGFTTRLENNIEEVVNLSPSTTLDDGMTYDLNPCGTYYVTTGAAGHRYGWRERADGIWADVDDTTGEGILPSKTYTSSKYAIEVGRINKSNSYTEYTYSTATSDQIFNVGDYATGNVNAPMFGILNINDNKLTYNFYSATGDDVKLFDTLAIMKS